ncbi:MAG: hypothetical protein LBQ57_08175 [Spirochaetales bacterium]|nr:hypothetical protein [Spirochaetales bacterium]
MLIFLAGAAFLPAQTPLEEEAPENIFDAQIGDTDVDLYLEGYWDASVKGGLGFAFIPGQGWSYPYVFPEFPDGFEYDQKPDLILSLWLKERFFFETTINEDYELNTYLLGYQGKPGEFVQSVKAGNRGVEISPFPYMEFPGSSRHSPALSTMFQTERTQHEFLFRYDPSLPRKKTFIGKNEVEEARIDPANYVRGRFFVLPDTEVSLPDLSLYIEDAKGTITGDNGRRYRRATNFDYSYLPEDGSITLTNASAGRVLVYYTKGGAEVGNPSLGRGALPNYITGPPLEIDPAGAPLDFDWGLSYMGSPLTDYQVTIDGRAALLLYDPGAWNPFEITGAYSLSGTAASMNNSTNLRIVHRGADSLYTTSQPLSLSMSESYSIVRVLPSGTAQGRSMQARFPFAADEPYLYGPDRLKDGGGADFELLIQSYMPVQSLILTNDVIPGSVTIYRNGREETSFSVDYESGRISLPFEPAPSDRIEVYYRTYSGEGQGGDILFGSGSTLYLSEALTLKIATGLRWNVMKGKYSTEPGDHPGIVGASAQVNYRSENFNITADGAVIYTNPDTSGLLRLLGMEKHNMELETNKNNMFPSSAPDPILLTSFLGLRLDNSNRGRLLFKNYETKNLAGSVTLNSWSDAPSRQWAYEDGSLIGPYVASDRGAGFDNIMVMDYELDGAQQWVGAQMNLSTGWDDALDLSNISAVRFAYRVAKPVSGPFNGDVSLHFQAGALDEDLDGDGYLDEEAGASSRGYAFNHGVLTLYVGAGQEGFGNDIRDSEDANRNRILERENPPLVFSSQLMDTGGLGSPVVFTGETGWEAGVVRIPPDMRSRMTQVRAIRFIVRREGGDTNPRAGRILIGKLVFEGSSLSPRVTGAGSLRLREIPEILADGYAAPPLQNVYSEPLKTFHSNDEATDQHILEATWKNIAPADSWEIRGFTTEIPPENYRSLNMFMRFAKIETPGSARARLRLAYTDSAGKGLILSFEVPSPALPITAVSAASWQKLTIDIADRKAWLGDTELTAAAGNTLRIDSDSVEWNRFSLKFENSGGAQEGTVYLDEVYLSDPRDTVGFAGSTDISLYLPGDVLSVGGVSILRNVSLSEKISGRNSEFKGQKEAAADTDYSVGHFNSASAVSGEVLGVVYAEGEFAVNALEDRKEYEGGHSVRIPAEGGVIVFRDQYKRNFNTLLPAMSRSNSLESSPLNGLSLRAGAETYLASGALTQNWNSQADINPAGNASVSTRLSLRNIAEGYVLDEETSYSDSWLSSYELLLPWNEGRDAERQGTLRLDGNFTGEVIGLIFNPEVSFINSGERDGRQRGISSVSVEVPLVFRDSPNEPGWRLSVLYSRRADTTISVPVEGDFSSDTRNLTDTMRRQRFFYNSIPYLEIFAHSDRSTFAEDTEYLIRSDYTPQAGLRYSRAYGSSIRDLFLPSQAEARAKKTYTRGGEVLSASNAYDLSLTNFAINLFGSSGSYPFFSWYSVDEFQLQNTLSLITQEEEKNMDWTATFHQIVNFTDRDANRILLDHTITLMNQDDEYSYKGAGALKYIWQSEMARDFGVGYLQKSRESGSYYQHTEKLELIYTRNEGLTAYLVAGHETALTLRKGSFIKAELNLGFGMERDYSGLPPGYKILFGLGAGLSAHFIF